MKSAIKPATNDQENTSNEPIAKQNRATRLAKLFKDEFRLENFGLSFETKLFVKHDPEDVLEDFHSGMVTFSTPFTLFSMDSLNN
jgi:hypothetical protein